MLRASTRLLLRTPSRPGAIASLPRVYSAAISSSAGLINTSAPSSRPSASSIPSTTFSVYRTMSTSFGESTVRPEPDQVVQDIADYVHSYKIDSELAFETARLCLIDTIGCGLEGLRFPECSRLLGPVVEGTVVPNGAYLTTLQNLMGNNLYFSSRYKGAWHQLSARSYPWSIQHWNDHPLARFQRLFPRGRMSYAFVTFFFFTFTDLIL